MLPHHSTYSVFTQIYFSIYLFSVPVAGGATLVIMVLKLLFVGFLSSFLFFLDSLML